MTLNTIVNFKHIPFTMQNRLNKESTDRNGYRGTAQCTHTYSDIHLIYLRSYKTEREYAVS